MATPLIHDIRNAIVETNSNLAFLINFELNLYEHQSTYSPNGTAGRVDIKTVGYV